VGTLVSGQVALQGDQVRVTITMIEGTSGKQLESTTIDSPRTNLFELQDSLSSQVAIFLRENIGVQVQTLEDRSGTKVVKAWELVQRAERTAAGAQELAATGELHGAQDQFAAADALLEQAEALDPAWTLPIARRGWYQYRYARAHGLQQAPQVEPIQRGLEHAERALALDSLDADALELRGTLNYWSSLLNLVEHDQQHAVVDAAADDLEKSTLENPRPASSLATLSHLFMNIGDIAQAKLTAQRSYEADPFLANANLTLWRLTNTSWDLGYGIESRRWCEEGLRRFAHDYRFRQCQLMLYGLRDYPPDVPRAWTLMGEFVDLAPTQVRQLSEKQGLMYVAWALARANLPDSAHAVAVRGRAGPDIDPLRDVAYMEVMLRTWLALAYKDKGQEDRANEQYDHAVEQLGLFLAANPVFLEGFRSDASRGRIDKWFLEGLVNQPGFRALVGVR
jgi:tetratricopeptide (TPR) repeat protein